MKLQEVFDQLSVGELSNISIGGAEQGIIDENNYSRIIPHINLALTALYKRFLLKEARIRVKLTKGMYTYLLHSDYAESNQKSIKPNKYILDSTAFPFKDDILKIERVNGEVGEPFGLNDGSDKFSLATPSINTIWTPTGITDGDIDLPDRFRTSYLDVIYRCNHPKIVEGNGYFDPERIEIELPHSHLMALLFYIASRVNNPLGMTNEFHVGNSYYAKYEAECQRIELDNIRIEGGSTYERFARGGWA